MRHPILTLFILIILSIFTLSCTKPQQQPTEPVAPATHAMSREEQQAAAFEEYGAILEYTRERSTLETRQYVADGYLKIINEYPDSDLAHEAYFRLIRIFMRDMYPPEVDKAEAIYRQYFERYADYQVADALNNEMGFQYYQNQMWEKLAIFSTPFLREYIKSGKYGDTMFFFYYAEAKFHLQHYEDSRKGFQLLLQLSPKSNEAIMARQRLKQINEVLAVQPEPAVNAQ